MDCDLFFHSLRAELGVSAAVWLPSMYLAQPTGLDGQNPLLI